MKIDDKGEYYLHKYKLLYINNLSNKAVVVRYF